MPTDAQLLQSLMNAESGGAVTQPPETGDAKLLNDLMASQTTVPVAPVLAGEELGIFEGAMRGLGRGGVGLLEVGAATLDVLSRSMTPVPMVVPKAGGGFTATMPDPNRGRFLKGPLDRLAEAEALRPSATVVAGGIFDPSNPKWWTERGAEVIPQLVVQLGVALGSGGTTVPGQVAAFSVTGGVLAAGNVYGEVFDDRIANGDTELEAANGALLESATVGALTSIIDRFGGKALLGKNTAVREALKKVVGTRVAAAGSAGVAEGATEMLQEVGQILAAKGFRDESVTIGEVADRLGAAGSLGAGAGVGVRGAVDLLPGQRAAAEATAEARVVEVTAEEPIVVPVKPPEAGEAEKEPSPTEVPETPPKPTEEPVEGVEGAEEVDEPDVDDVTPEVPSFSAKSVQNTLVDAMGSRGTSALDQVQVVLDAHNGLASEPDSSVNFLEQTNFAITPEEFHNLTFAQKNRARRNGVVVDEDAAQEVLDVVGDRLYDAAFEEATGDAGSATSNFADHVLMNSEAEDPNLAMAAFVQVRGADATPEQRGRRRTTMRADDLAVGQTFDILGETFEVRQVEGQRVIESENYTIQADGLSHVPVDSGTLRNASGDLLVASNRSGAAIEFQLRDIQSRLRAQNATVEALRDQLIRLVQTRFEGRADIPKSLLTVLQGVKTVDSLANAITKVREGALKLERIDSMKALDDQRKAVKKAGRLLPEFEDALKSIQSSIGGTAKNPRLTSKIKVPKNLPADATSLINLAATAPLGPLSSEDAVALSQGIADILNAAKLTNRLRRKAQSMDQKLVTEGVVAEMERDGSPLVQREVGVSGQVLPPRGILQNAVIRAMVGQEETMTPDVMARWLFGGENTVGYKVMYQDLADAQIEVFRGDQEGRDVMNQAISDAGYEAGSRELAKLSSTFAGVYNIYEQLIQGNKRGDTRAEIVEVVVEGGTVEMDRSQRMSLALALRDTETRKLVIEGAPLAISTSLQGDNFTMNESDIAAFELSFARTPEASIVDAMFKHVNTVDRAVLREWSIAHKGFDMTRSDDYWPRRRRKTGDRIEAEANPFEQMEQKAIESASLTQERTSDRKLAIEIGDAFTNFINHNWTAHSLANMAPALYSAKKVLDAPEVSKIVKNSRGSRLSNRYKMLFDTLARQVVGDNSSGGPLEQGIGRLAGNLTRALLGFNPKVALYQPVSQIMAANEIEAKYLIRAAASGAAFRTSIDESIKRDPYLRQRMEGGGQGLVSEGAGSEVAIAGFNERGRWSFMMIRMMDQAAIRVIYRAAQLKAQETGGDAGAIARKIVQRTQPTFDPLHISGTAIEARANPALKILSLFRAQRIKNQNVLYDAWINGDKQAVAVAVGTLMASGVLIALIQELWEAALGGGALTDESEEETVLRFSERIVSLTAGNVLFGEGPAVMVNFTGKKLIESYGSRDFRDAASGRPLFPPAITPVSGIVEDVFFGTARMASAEDIDDPDFWKGLLEVSTGVLAAKGVPVVSAVREISKAVKNAND